MGALLKSFLSVFPPIDDFLFFCVFVLLGAPKCTETRHIMHGCLRDCTSPPPDFLGDPDPDPLDRNEMLWSAFAAPWRNLRHAEVIQLSCRICIFLKTGETGWIARSRLCVTRSGSAGDGVRFSSSVTNCHDSTMSQSPASWRSRWLEDVGVCCYRFCGSLSASGSPHWNLSLWCKSYSRVRLLKHYPVHATPPCAGTIGLITNMIWSLTIF